MYSHQFSTHLLSTYGLLGSVLGTYCKIKNSNIKIVFQIIAWEVRTKSGHYNPIYSLDIRVLYITSIMSFSPPLLLCPLLCGFSMSKRFVRALHTMESFRWQCKEPSREYNSCISAHIFVS